MKRLLVLAFLICAIIFIASQHTITQAQSFPAWAANVAYKVGDQVTYQDATHPNHLYKCQQAHTSQVGWEPPNVPALWIDEGAYSGSSATATNTTAPTTAPTKTNTPIPTSGPSATPVPPTKTNTPAPTSTTGATTAPTKTNTPIPPTSTLAPTATSSGTGCWPAWNSSTAYTSGSQVSYNGHNWTANQWNQNEAPGGPAGAWNDNGPCGGSGPTFTPVPPTATTAPTKTFTPTFVPPTNTPGGPTATKTNTPLPTATAGGSSGSLPRHIITGYWQDFTNGATALKLSSVPTTYNLIAVAFANADPNNAGGVTFSIDSGLSTALGGYTAANFISDISTLHSQGRKVIISVGGQNGTISVSDPTSATNFANSAYSLMTQYGFDGVDIDLENGINVTYMTSALQQLSSKAGPNLIITLAPQTIDMQSTGSGYFQLALNIKTILTIVNTQYYNSGSMLGCDGKVYSEGTEDFLTALACIQLQGGLRPDQVGLGLPANSSGAGGGAVAPSVVNAALDCLETGTNCGTFHPTTTYSGIRGAMDWSINWDASASYNFANTVSAHFSSLP